MLRQRLAACAQGVLEAGLVMASGWRVTGLEQVRLEEGHSWSLGPKGCQALVSFRMPWRACKTQASGPQTQNSVSVSLRRGLRICPF